MIFLEDLVIPLEVKEQSANGYCFMRNEFSAIATMCWEERCSVISSEVP